MQQGMGTLDFFLLESGDYLEQLDVLAQAPAGSPPATEELLRLARAFRGCALMASQHALARAAQGLESCARAMREGRLEWSEQVRGEVIRALDDVKVLTRRLREPDQGDTERAEAIGQTLDRLSGRASAVMRAVEAPGLDAGGRAFVAREAAAIASVLQRAAVALGTPGGGREALEHVIPSMSSLRGVAAINDLPPLADLLAALESAVAEASSLRPGDEARTAAAAFEAGAQALARAAREVVDSGKPDLNSEEARTFAGQLLTTFAGGHIVSVESLFYDDAGPHIVHEGTAPTAAAGAAYGRVEMVSQGEFLTAATAELQRVAASEVQRDLRLFIIAARLRPLVGAAGNPLTAAIGRVAEATRDAIGRGAAAEAPAEFIALMGHAAETLTARTADDMAMAERLESAAAGLAALSSSASAARVPATPMRAAPAPAAPTPAAAVPAATAPLLPAPAPAVAAPVPVPDRGPADLAASYVTLASLIAERGLPEGSLDELLAGGVAAAATAVPSTPAAPMRGPRGTVPSTRPIVPVESLAPDAPPVVPVETLLYGGERALRRALELKPALLAAAQTHPADGHLTALLHEVLDLVELGLASDR